MKTIISRGLRPLGVMWLLLHGVLVQAAPAYNPNVSPSQMSTILDGPGLSVRNLAVTHGIAQQYGIFTSGAEVLGVNTGVFLSTGNLSSVQAPNSSASYSSNTKIQYLDPDLGKISANAKYDPAIIEFDITPQGDRVNFVFAFGSEEYPEYVCSRFNDVFGLFVSGPGLNGVKNAAFMPDTGDAVAVNNVNAGAKGVNADDASCNLGNVAYFVDNGNGTGSNQGQLDGYTRPMTASLAGLTAGQTYHIKLALADAGDPAYDSGAFFKWLTSTQSTPVDLALQASASTTSPAWNSEVELSYTVKNTSATATSLVQVGLEWPAGLTWVGDDSAGRYDATTGVWDADAIAANGSKTLKVRARVGTASSYRVNGEITFAFNEDTDSTPFNRSIFPNEDDTASVTVNPVNKPANQPPVITSNNGVAAATLSLPEGQVSLPSVTATDPDANALIYSISGTDAARFTINATTGALSFKVAPDYEAPTDADLNNTYVLQVAVTDGTLSATQALTVQVTNIAENTNAAPQITSDGGGDVAHLLADENQIEAANVDATDVNKDPLTYRISGGADVSLFKITATTGRLRFLAAPDYEKPLDVNHDRTYEVEVTVSDGDLSDKQMLYIGLTNLPDENAPPDIVSDGGNATAVVQPKENQTIVTTVLAVDANSPVLTYSITGGTDAALFSINSTSGALTFLKAPDYEVPTDSDKNNVYNVIVMVSDGSLTDSQALQVSVADVSGENLPPSITNPSAITFPENSTVIVLDLTADDNKDAEGNGLVYTLAGQVDDALFTLNPATGELLFKKPPDYEKPQDANKDRAYIVGIKVCDSQGACAERVLIVSVQDVDEDNDKDGLMDSVEKVVGTDPWKADTDGDGIGDKPEVDDSTVPLDYDKDGIIDALDEDDDNDSIATRYEMPDPNGDGNHLDARDSDADGIADYLDTDDDNDTVLTRYEVPDANKDGNPNDARDTDKDSKFDYLDTDDDNDGSSTATEKPDPNGDGNPADAVDNNGNGIAAYLDIEEDFLVTLQLRVFLQGPYSTSTGLMANDLLRKGVLPTLQPYGELKSAFGYVDSGSTVSPFNYPGKETASTSVMSATGKDTPVDWVLVEVRDKFDPTVRVAAMAALLQSDGDVVDAATGSKTLQLFNVMDGDYYVVVRHRNHLGVMTNAPIPLKTPPELIDFTHPGTKVYGGVNARLINNSLALLWAGDTNNSNTIILGGPGSDGSVILGAILVSPDNKLVNTAFRLLGYYATDLNMDGAAMFTGPSNDTNVLLGNVLMHPDNLSYSNNFIITGSLPR